MWNLRATAAFFGEGETNDVLLLFLFSGSCVLFGLHQAEKLIRGRKKKLERRGELARGPRAPRFCQRRRKREEKLA